MNSNIPTVHISDMCKLFVSSLTSPTIIIDRTNNGSNNSSKAQGAAPTATAATVYNVCAYGKGTYLQVPVPYCTSDVIAGVAR